MVVSCKFFDRNPQACCRDTRGRRLLKKCRIVTTSRPKVRLPRHAKSDSTRTHAPGIHHDEPAGQLLEDLQKRGGSCLSWPWPRFRSSWGSWMPTSGSKRIRDPQKSAGLWLLALAVPDGTRSCCANGVAVSSKGTAEALPPQEWYLGECKQVPSSMEHLGYSDCQ